MSDDLPHSASDLSRIYAQRFASNQAYRQRVWRILIDDYFRQFIPSSASVLDLGCGYGEFINGIRSARRFAMDLNQDATKFLEAGVEFLCQDCSQPTARSRGPFRSVRWMWCSRAIFSSICPISAR